MLTLEQIIHAVSSVAKDYSIKSIKLFGSYANGTNTPNSDIDLLVEFLTPSVSLLTLAALQDRLENMLQTDVDIIHAPLPENAMIKPEKVVSIYAA